MVTAIIEDDLQPLLDALEISPDAVFVTDRRNRIVLWNKAVEHLLGYTSREVVGYSCGGILLGTDSFGNRYCSDPCPVVQIAARGESVRRFDLQLQTKDKRRLNVEVTVLNLTSARQHTLLLPHIIRPIEARSTEVVPPQPSNRRDSTTDARARKLTSREIEVLTMLAAGRTSAEISETLGIAPLTARNHVQNILEKLEVHSKAEAVAFAYRQRLL